MRALTEHLRVLAGHASFALLGNVAGSITLAVGLWTVTVTNLLLIWMLAMIVFNLGRWIIGRRFPTGVIGAAEARRWERKFLLSVGISGVLWGIAGSLFYVQDQPEYSLFLALMIVGMCAATTANLSYHRYAYPIFLLPAITPVTFNLMLDDNLTASAIGFVIPFYFTLLYLLSRQIYQTAHESILARINSQYQAMFDYLTGVANRRAFEEAL